MIKHLLKIMKPVSKFFQVDKQLHQDFKVPISNHWEKQPFFVLGLRPTHGKWLPIVQWVRNDLVFGTQVSWFYSVVQHTHLETLCFLSATERKVAIPLSKWEVKKIRKKQSDGNLLLHFHYLQAIYPIKKYHQSLSAI